MTEPSITQPEFRAALEREQQALEALRVAEGRLAEGVEFLPKPYSPESLARRVRAVLDEGR